MKSTHSRSLSQSLSLDVPLARQPFRLLALQLAGLILCSPMLSTAAESTVQLVPIATAQLKSVGMGFELDGVVQPVKQSTVSAQASGRIAAFNVKAGDKVKAGQVLATVDDRETQTGVQRSQAQVAQAQADLRNAQANFNRTKDLQSKGFVSAAALDTADAQLKSALAGRDQAGAGLKQSSIAQGFTKVLAPYDGWVLQTMAEAGDLAVPGKPLLTVYAPTPLRAVVQVPVSRSGAVATSASAGSVEMRLTGTDGTEKWIRPASHQNVATADAVSQTIEWRFDLPMDTTKTFTALLPGQQIKVRFAGSQASKMIVPSSAILRRGELTAVYVATGETFVLKAVRLGADQGAQGVEIVAGLQAGDRVALDPVKAGLAGAKPATK